MPCTNVMHNELNCVAAGLPPEEWCTYCSIESLTPQAEQRLRNLLHVMSVIRKEDPKFWDQLVNRAVGILSRNRNIAD